MSESRHVQPVIEEGVFVRVIALLWFRMHDEHRIESDALLDDIEESLAKRFNPVKTDELKRSIMNEIIGLYNDSCDSGRGVFDLD